MRVILISQSALYQSCQHFAQPQIRVWGEVLLPVGMPCTETCSGKGAESQAWSRKCMAMVIHGKDCPEKLGMKDFMRKVCCDQPTQHPRVGLYQPRISEKQHWQSENHTLGWLGKENGKIMSIHTPTMGTPSPRPGCSKLHPNAF